MASAPVNLQIIQTNTSNEDLPLNYTATFNAPLLQDPSQYAVAITRFKLPARNIESFLMADRSKYYLKMGSTNVSIANNTRWQEWTEYLPDSTGENPNDPDEYLGEVRYYSPSQVLDIFSRATYRLFIGYCSLWPSYIWDPTLITGQSWRTQASKSWTSTYTVSNIPTNSFIAGMEFKIFRFISSKTPITSNDPATYTPIDLPTTIRLISPKGTECIIYAGGLAQFVSLSNYFSNRYIKITEGAYYSTYNLDFSRSNKPVHTILPLNESFIKFTGEQANGNWRVQFDTYDFIYGDFEYQIKFYSLPTGFYLPETPPNFSLDGERVVCNVEEKFMKSDITFMMSPTVKAMLDFGPVYTMKWDNGDYAFKFPSIIYDSSVATKIYTVYQFAPHLESLSNIARILVNSPSLSVNNDYVLSDIQLAGSTMIGDFLPDQSSDGIGDLLYSTDSSIRPWRVYQLTSQQPMTSISVEVIIEYVNGLKKTVSIPPNSTMQMRLSFFRL